MKKTLKIISIFLALLITAAAFTGCANKRKKGDPPVWIKDKRVVMTINDYNVPHDFYAYLFKNAKYYYDQGDEAYWQKEGNDVKKIQDYVFDILKETYAVFTLADEYDITLSETDKLDIDDQIAQAKKSFGKNFETELKNAFMTEELFRYSLEIQQLETLLYEHIISEESGILKADDQTVTEGIKSEFARATHILFTFANDIDRQKAIEDADKVLQKLKNGEDFETLKDEYSDDTSLNGNKNGYYFAPGEFANEFEYTAFKLKENEISEVVETSAGFHIVKRLPLEDSYIDKNFETLRTQYLTRQYYKMIEETSKDFTPVYQDKYAAMQIDTFN